MKKCLKDESLGMNAIELFNILKSDELGGEITNPYFQARLIRIRIKIKEGCRIFLGQLGFEEFLVAFEDLELLLEQGNKVGKFADLSLSAEARELKWCNYLTLKNLLENHSYLLEGLPLSSKFTDFQMYALVALIDFGFAEQALLKLNRPYEEDIELSCSSLIEFSSNLIGAEEVLNHIFTLLTSRVTGGTIESLHNRVQTILNGNSKGGKETKFKNVMPKFIEEAQRKWNEQTLIGVPLYKKKDMCAYLIDRLYEDLPPRYFGSKEKLKPSESVIWDVWLKDGKPQGARNKSQNK